MQIVKSILHDITAEDIKQQTTQEPLQPRNNSSEATSFTARSLFIQYIPFGKSSLEPLLTHIGTRKELAVDHLRLLREDSGYFFASMQEWKEHIELDDCHEIAREMIDTAMSDILCWDRLLSSVSIISNTGSIPEDPWIATMDAINSVKACL